MKRIIFHVDVNNAFLSWEASDLLKKGSKLDIRTIPSVIGGDKSIRHGVVLAKSPLAKKYNIVTGESLYNALKKCKDLKVYEPHYNLYEKESDKLYNLLLKYFPKVERISIDECFADYTGMNNLLGDPLELAYKIKDEINNLYGWTVNVGLGNTKLTAKMASDFEKPNKVHTLFDEEVKIKMWPLKVNELYMVGKVTSVKLIDMGIKTIGDLANYDYNKLQLIFKKQAKYMYEYANGIDDSIVNDIPTDNKGISISHTTPKDLETKEEIKELLWAIVNELGIKLRKENVSASLIVLFMRTNKFINYSKQKQILNATSNSKDLFKEVCILLNSMYNDIPIRLVGVRVSSFTNSDVEQISLFDIPNSNKHNKSLDKTIDKIKDKYGDNIIEYASIKKKIDK